MAVARQVTVTGAAGGTEVAGTTTPGGGRVRLKNLTATTSCYVGGNENVEGQASALSATTGVLLGPAQTLDLVIDDAETIKARSAISTISVTVEVFRTGGTIVR